MNAAEHPTWVIEAANAVIASLQQSLGFCFFWRELTNEVRARLIESIENSIAQNAPGAP